MLCGNRFGRGLVRPGGCRHDLDPARAAILLERLNVALADTVQAVAWFWDAASVRARLENVGQIFPAQAAGIGLVGPAARACGLVRDVRYDHASGWYRFAQAPVTVWPDGDVFARARVRSLEIQRSGEFLREQLAAPPEGGLLDALPSALPDTLAVALVEGWRGEVCHVALTDSEGQFRRYKITDPSFHNWIGLALSLRGTAISDFPICNKSFNLSYCGFDL
jgi:Ni,Fe-hydrogenase III large subunit